MDRHKQTDRETSFHKTFAIRLENNTALRDDTRFASIKLKGGPNVTATLVCPDGSAGPATVDAEVSLELLLECLKDLEQENALIVSDPEPTRPGPDGRPIYTIYSALKDVYADERVKRGDDDDIMDADDQQRPAGRGCSADSRGTCRDTRLRQGIL